MSAVAQVGAQVGVHAGWTQMLVGGLSWPELGALVCLVDADDKQQLLFLGPDGGSMTLMSDAQRVQVISSEAPLCRALLGKSEGDEVSMQIASVRQQFEVLWVR